MPQTKQIKKVFALRGHQPKRSTITKLNLNISDPDLKINTVRHGAVLGINNGKATRHFGSSTRVLFASGRKVSFLERLGTKEAVHQARKSISKGT